ncbi:hypothetical protein H5410_028496 [Solanum commersonii]|uniref:Uncharacterized protein n=1 Tax=Solanum commersonii TaxID=4109 RepID=A0A9J5Z6B3_SOLCO|nr:hypothetical protein H5410_028496 [Solanum commersonii]
MEWNIGLKELVKLEQLIGVGGRGERPRGVGGWGRECLRVSDLEAPGRSVGRERPWRWGCSTGDIEAPDVVVAWGVGVARPRGAGRCHGVSGLEEWWCGGRGCRWVNDLEAWVVEGGGTGGDSNYFLEMYVKYSVLVESISSNYETESATLNCEAKKSHVKAFIKLVNYNHIMPTHYTFSVDLKDVDVERLDFLVVQMLEDTAYLWTLLTMLQRLMGKACALAFGIWSNELTSRPTALLGRITSAVHQLTLATDLEGLQERITTIKKGKNRWFYLLLWILNLSTKYIDWLNNKKLGHLLKILHINDDCRNLYSRSLLEEI